MIGLILSGCGNGNDTPTGTSAGASEELRPVIEALFLGSGPLIPRDGLTACPSQGRWNGFPRGTTVRVRVSTTVSGDKRAAIQQTADQVSEATNGAVNCGGRTDRRPESHSGCQ